MDGIIDSWDRTIFAICDLKGDVFWKYEIGVEARLLRFGLLESDRCDVVAVSASVDVKAPMKFEGFMNLKETCGANGEMKGFSEMGFMFDSLVTDDEPSPHYWTALFDVGLEYEKEIFFLHRGNFGLARPIGIHSLQDGLLGVRHWAFIVGHSVEEACYSRVGIAWFDLPLSRIQCEARYNPDAPHLSWNAHTSNSWRKRRIRRV
ncbi:hypothetical protein P154DRAFT_532122 [Amniculicola lignicola CBS 123094]|uniref:Uncharacterized protein n=1 Tax=Amniculicola lignicola CBS 123094 TaxID=1392246 RepID=A0A6A5WU78_9PLEO|nr:hypothetical protein P154DRAFT_532122 [Amniculicola lignicola CBS 123094]